MELNTIERIAYPGRAVLNISNLNEKNIKLFEREKGGKQDQMVLCIRKKPQNYANTITRRKNSILMFYFI